MCFLSLVLETNSTLLGKSSLSVCLCPKESYLRYSDISIISKRNVTVSFSIKSALRGLRCRNKNKHCHCTLH